MLNENINQKLKNKNSLLVTFFILLFTTTFFCFYSFNNEAYFQIYLTGNDKLQKQKKADLKEADEDKFLLIFFGIGMAILFFFIIFCIVKKIFFSSSNVDKIESYYKAIEKVNEESKNNLRKLRQELSENKLLSYIKNFFRQEEIKRGVFEQFQICIQYLKSINEPLQKIKTIKEETGKFFVHYPELNREYTALKEKYNYLVKKVHDFSSSKRIKETVNFNEKVVEFQKKYNSFCSLLETKKKENEIQDSVNFSNKDSRLIKEINDENNINNNSIDNIENENNINNNSIDNENNIENENNINNNSIDNENNIDNINNIVEEDDKSKNNEEEDEEDEHQNFLRNRKNNKTNKTEEEENKKNNDDLINPYELPLNDDDDVSSLLLKDSDIINEKDNKNNDLDINKKKEKNSNNNSEKDKEKYEKFNNIKKPTNNNNKNNTSFQISSEIPKMLLKIKKDLPPNSAANILDEGHDLVTDVNYNAYNTGYKTYNFVINDRRKKRSSTNLILKTPIKQNNYIQNLSFNMSENQNNDSGLIRRQYQNNLFSNSFNNNYGNDNHIFSNLYEANKKGKYKKINTNSNSKTPIKDSKNNRLPKFNMFKNYH